MDGLLVDSEPLWFEIERAFVRTHGHEWTAAHARACIGQGIQTTIATMGATFGFEVDLARSAQAIVGAFIERAADLRLKPGARELLDAAAHRRVPTALASSSP